MNHTDEEKEVKDTLMALVFSPGGNSSDEDSSSLLGGLLPSGFTAEQEAELTSRLLELVEEGHAMRIENLDRVIAEIQGLRNLRQAEFDQFRDQHGAGSDGHSQGASTAPAASLPAPDNDGIKLPRAGSKALAVLRLVPSSDGTAVAIKKLIPRAVKSKTVNSDDEDSDVVQRRVGATLASLQKNGLVQNVGEGKRGLWIQTAVATRLLSVGTIAGGSNRPRRNQSSSTAKANGRLPREGSKIKMVYDLLGIGEENATPARGIVDSLIDDSDFNGSGSSRSKVTTAVCNILAGLARKSLVVQVGKRGSMQWYRPESDEDDETEDEGEAIDSAPTTPPSRRRGGAPKKTAGGQASMVPDIDLSRLPKFLGESKGRPWEDKAWDEILQCAVTCFGLVFSYNQVFEKISSVAQACGWDTSLVRSSEIQNKLSGAVTRLREKGIITVAENRDTVTVIQRPSEGEDDEGDPADPDSEESEEEEAEEGKSDSLDNEFDLGEEDEDEEDDEGPKPSRHKAKKEITTDTDWRSAILEALERLGDDTYSEEDVWDFIDSTKSSYCPSSNMDQADFESKVFDCIVALVDKGEIEEDEDGKYRLA